MLICSPPLVHRQKASYWCYIDTYYRFALCVVYYWCTSSKMGEYGPKVNGKRCILVPVVSVLGTCRKRVVRFRYFGTSRERAIRYRYFDTLFRYFNPLFQANHSDLKIKKIDNLFFWPPTYSTSKTSTTLRESLHPTDPAQISYTVSWYHKATFDTLHFPKEVFSLHPSTGT